MKNVGGGNVNRLAWKRRDVERHFDVLDMVAGCKAGADCEGWGAGVTEAECQAVS